MKRYEIRSRFTDGWSCVERPNGDWVKWEDVEKLEKDRNGWCRDWASNEADLAVANKRISKLEAENTKYREALESISNCGLDNSAMGYYTCQDIAREALLLKEEV
jgi:hypothetical protein